MISNKGTKTEGTQCRVFACEDRLKRARGKRGPYIGKKNDHNRKKSRG